MRNNNNNRKDKRNFSHHSSNNALPALKILENYQANSPELVNKMLEMAKKEQEHRHSWQNQYLESYQRSYRVGQITGIIYNLSLLGLISYLIINGDKILALKLFAINALLIFLAITVTFIERRITTKKPGGKKPKTNKKSVHRPSARNLNFETKS